MGSKTLAEQKRGLKRLKHNEMYLLVVAPYSIVLDFLFDLCRSLSKPHFFHRNLAPNRKESDFL